MKRKRKSQRDQRVDKRQKTDNDASDRINSPLLHQYYPKVLTLRHYLASKLRKFKKRQKRLLHYGIYGAKDSASEADAALTRLLDETIVGTFCHADIVDVNDLDKDLTVFTQQLSQLSATISPTQGAFKQSEIVDCAVWLLFRRHHGPFNPPHIMAHGFQRTATFPNSDAKLVPGAPGIWAGRINPSIEALKAHPWCALPPLLGKGAERIIVDMLLQCGIFQAVDMNRNNLSQLSGVRLHDLKPTRPTESTLPKKSPSESRTVPDEIANRKTSKNRGLSDIRFARHRMLYAKPGLNAKGKIQFGLGHMHVLNRCCDVHDEQQTVHVMKYMFPRQFALHNVFQSEVSPQEAAQSFKDYTVRDEEIRRLERRWVQKRTANGVEMTETFQPLPKRLRFDVPRLVACLRKRHSKCSYKSLLDYYCPRLDKTASVNSTSIGQASSVAQVSAFCRSAVVNVFPSEFWGKGGLGRHNKDSVLRRVDTFIRLRRYESLSLHDVLQRVKIQHIQWAAMSDTNGSSKLSITDFTKRKELMAELLYYLFDSFLIPLIRAHFYVTESSTNCNQVFYFRHDVWKAISDPVMASLKSSMLEPFRPSEIKRTLARRELGVSKVRLLPKEKGMRPIINLKQRRQKSRFGQLVLAKSINKVLNSPFSVLNYEKRTNPRMLASALFSVEDMYSRLQEFRNTLKENGLAGSPLFFAKVDVKACFDTIPQKRLLKLAKSIFSADTYHIAKYARGKLIGGHNKETPKFGAKPSWKHLLKATVGDQGFDFYGEARSDSAGGRTRATYVDGDYRREEQRSAIFNLLEEHVECNLIKVGNRVYRQKEGIPQGSKVSSLLCSYFYAELEREALSFVHDGQSILLRLIDDFLVISTSQKIAERFMQVMHAGLPEFGVEVKAEKSRANFAVEIDGKMISRLPSHSDFPYCGNAINTSTLDVSKDKERSRKNDLPNATTVEYSRLPGQEFYRKMMNALKLQMHAMLLSTAYNSSTTVLSNLHHTFSEVAQKSYHYIRSFPNAKRPPDKLVIKTADDLIKLACVLMKRRKRTSKDLLPYECSVSKAQARWLACTAFLEVFRRRQTKHKMLISWLEAQLAMPELRTQAKDLGAAVRK